MKIIQEPFEISLAKNPVIYRVESTNLWGNHAIYPNLVLIFDDKAEQGDGFRFQITDPDSGKPVFFKFNAAPTVDDDGWVYINDDHVGTQAEYTEEVYNQLLKNELLAYYFTLEYDGDVTITFTANFAVADLVPTDFEKIQFNLFVTPTDHFDYTISTLYLEKQRRSNFRMIADVYFEDNKDSNQWRKVATLTDSPNDDGISIFDISSILKHEIDVSFNEPPLPAYGNNSVYQNQLNKRYYVAFCETYENQAVPEYWNVQLPKLVHWGGVSIEDWAKGNPFTFLAVSEKFLTWWPNNKILKTNQNDWLTWINFTNDEIDVYAQYRVYYTDGTDSGWVTWGDTFTLDKWDEITIPVGYTQIGIADVDPSKTAYKWQISVKEDGGGIVSEIRTFMFNDVISLHDREIIYLNAFGAPETFLTVGVWETVTEIEKQNTERQLPFDYKIIGGQTFQFNQTSKTNYSARTGYMEQNALLALKTLLQETNCYLNDQEWVPIILFADSFSIAKDMRFLHSLNFELARSFREDRHSLITRKPIFLPIVSCSFTGFQVDVNGQDVDTFGTLELSKDDVVLEAAVVYDTINERYTFSAKHEAGVYRVKVEFNMADGTDLAFDFNYELKHETAYVDIPDKGAIEIIMKNRSGELDTKLFVDWDINLPAEEYLITTSPTSLTETIFHKGRKRVKLTTLCPEKIGFVHLDENTKDFNLNIFHRLTQLKLSFCQTTGTIDISAFQELTIIEITDTSIEHIQFGFHKDVTYINLESNQLTADNIELILLEIWKWRNYYGTGAKSLYLGGNPGAGLSMTSTSLAIINGTGTYTGEGLASDYSFSITY